MPMRCWTWSARPVSTGGSARRSETAVERPSSPRGGADEVFVAARAALAAALYFAGELDEAWAAALRAIEHPDAAHRPPGYASAQATLALVAADRGRLVTALSHAEYARLSLGRINSNRSWLGANTAVATGAVLAGEGDLASAEREFALAEQFFRERSQRPSRPRAGPARRDSLPAWPP